MPAKDRYHDVVKRALIKDGWIITREQVALIIGKRRLFVDIQISKLGETDAALIEVKTFQQPDSQVEAFANALGQYLLYETALRYIG
jgi:hypothetical protein